MKLFYCDCPAKNPIFFENVVCNACGRLVGFCAELGQMLAFEPSDEVGLWKSAAGDIYQQCENYSVRQICNWMVPAGDPNALCRACRCNDVIPDLSQPSNIDYWRKIEAAKRHALYSTLSLNLPLSSKHEDPELGLLFRFMADKEPVSEFTEPLSGQKPVMTGHNDGEITLNLAEADDVARTRIRVRLGEAYRTLVGHFRHEIGHYYWFRLFKHQPAQVERFRKVFGDERQDYDAALRQHYARGAPLDWPEQFISPYASMHPWEDWAECWAHYMHMLDTLETAQAFSLKLEQPTPSIDLSTDNLKKTDIKVLLDDWVRLAIAMNALNRSMGMPDPYPFVLNGAVQMKLHYIHEVIVSEH